jgi:uncharacterized protein DUF3455
MTIFTTFVNLTRLTAMLAAGTFQLAAADGASTNEGHGEPTTDRDPPVTLKDSHAYCCREPKGSPMRLRLRMPLFAASLAGSLLPPTQTFAQVPAAIAVSGETTVATFHAEGAQVYECQLDPASKLVWQFREPIAALILDGKTVGLHSAGPNWQHFDGSAVRAKMVSSAPGATSNDVPWLKLEVTEQRGNGILSHVATVQRINTKGGATRGPCETAGVYHSVSYSADYVFLRKGN